MGNINVPALDLCARLKVLCKEYLNRPKLPRHCRASQKIDFQNPQAISRWWMSACVSDSKTPRCSRRLLLGLDFLFQTQGIELFPGWVIERSFQPSHLRGSFLCGACSRPACGGQKALPFFASKLTALVGIYNYLLLGFTSPYSHQQNVDNQLGVNSWAHGPVPEWTLGRIAKRFTNGDKKVKFSVVRNSQAGQHRQLATQSLLQKN